jgi:hypothetical protein
MLQDILKKMHIGSLMFDGNRMTNPPDRIKANPLEWGKLHK